ncbi:hypothetical protein Rsub_12405 [Raphidocelis subcapitata]|uniref:Uncharacterized protein n=1 Tax=Raphidocelis subcapitata TaxID=307507 RepID=A0A2V0PNL6_9CHLO|nr:hypothetical protein Rsub_12405 [Raphidocelis subcapitata]|eukprot:GBF99693.1 hypothetical protein Rsub_12405 [Raphidocelis subcapitata]
MATQLITRGAASLRVRASLPLDRPGGGASRAGSPAPAVVVPAVPMLLAVSRPGGGAARLGPTPVAAASGAVPGAFNVERPGGGGSRASVFGSASPEQSPVVPMALPERPGGGGSRGAPLGGDGGSGGSGGEGGGSGGSGGNGGGGGGSGSDGESSGILRNLPALLAGWAGVCALAYTANAAFFGPKPAAKPKSCCGGAKPVPKPKSCCAGKA